MDVQLQELIDKIKKDGIGAASEEASRVKAQAESEAKRILDAARKEADDIIEKGKLAAQRDEKAGIAAVEQASRNLVLAFKGEIQALLDKLVSKELNSSYNSDVLKNTIPEIIKAWASRGSDSLTVLLPEGSLKSLDSFFRDKLAAELKKGLELKPDRGMSAGFKIAEQDGNAYYDFSAESVSELLCAYLNPRLTEILKDAVKGI